MDKSAVVIRLSFRTNDLVFIFNTLLARSKYRQQLAGTEPLNYIGNNNIELCRMFKMQIITVLVSAQQNVLILLF
jgi:hypothetical protein